MSHRGTLKYFHNGTQRGDKPSSSSEIDRKWTTRSFIRPVDEQDSFRTTTQFYHSRYQLFSLPLITHKMFARIATFFLFCCFALCASAVAVPSGNQCSSGAIQCCNSVQDADSAAVAVLTGLLGIVLSSLTGQVGVNCTPISVIGVGGNSCTQQTVCCTDNSFNGLIAAGCTPVNLNL
ncbi:hypothetical protein D9615_010275 [Tricholomella constricta]|uniref:Hydrophobin n=1 Tax=Tricholomella constricta TaxID=117010 RepID=A0A8H5LRI0_9AGAR|nr:hypothetical protein D9615_010275 [Tricholomella constricta]